MLDMDWELIARQWLRAARGRRSQAAFSRRLGYRSNVAFSWESGRRAPTAAEFFRALGRVGVDLRAALGRFYRTPPPWLGDGDPASPAGVARLLADLRGDQPLGRVAAAAGRSRFAIARWVGGEAEPRLPDFLRVVEALSLRALDLVAATVDMAAIPAAAEAWGRLEAQRRAAYEHPWTQAVLRALELETPGHRDATWIAAKLGVDPAVVEEGLAVLLRAGQLRAGPAGWEAEAGVAVDTRRDAEAGRRLKAFWAEVGLERLRAGDAGLYSYNVFVVSEADLERLRALHLAYFRDLRAIVAASSPGERVCVANVQLFALGR